MRFCFCSREGTRWVVPKCTREASLAESLFRPTATLHVASSIYTYTITTLYDKQCLSCIKVLDEGILHVHHHVWASPDQHYPQPLPLWRSAHAKANMNAEQVSEPTYGWVESWVGRTTQPHRSPMV